MDESPEARKAVEASNQDPRIKRLHSDQEPRQQSGDEQETYSLPATREMDWQNHFPLLQKHDASRADRAGGRKSSNCNIVSQSQSGLRRASPLSSNHPGVVAEELILKSFKSPGMSLGGSSTSEEKSPFGTRLLRNVTRISRGADTTTSGSNSIAFLDDAAKLSRVPYGTLKVMPIAQLEQRGKFVTSTNAAIRSPEAMQTKVTPQSGFLQFFTKKKSKGKGMASRQQNNVHDILEDPVHNRDTLLLDNDLEEMPNLSSIPNAKKDQTSLLGGGCGSTRVSPSHNEGMNLREWLKPKISKFERMHMFKQILDLVDICHSQGIGLTHLQPSYFVVMPINQVRYVGSFSSQGQVVQKPELEDSCSLYHQFKRKRHTEQGKETRDMSMTKHQRIREPNDICLGNFGYPIRSGHQTESEDDENEVDSSRKRYFRYDARELKLSSVGTQCFMPKQLMKLEDRWYASPEELNSEVWLFSSNIYSLGVLFFELFCCFETWEVHSAAMLDLRYRILPPNFLSENPKEACFCLWLSHPDPSSRPTSRDVLLSNLISGSTDFSLLGHSSALIEEEDVEADLLSHFLLCLKEQKEKLAAKLVAGLGCLNTDIEEVEKRHLLRLEIFTCGKGLPNNYNVSTLDTHEKSVGDESSFSAMHPYEERLMKNFDQLESAYFSMRSKIEIYEASSVTRPDNDVLKICDKYCQIQNEVVENKTADCFGTFFEGLCKYARYNKFEVCGSLKNVDILNSANVICSLSFDRDEEYFAAAGVSKKIKIFEFDALLNENVDIHYPLIEMSNISKLSCVCWNSYIKNYLASTDYDGVVQLWDVSTGQGFAQLIEHQKRAWSVNFSQVDPTKLASGSDDSYVKLWRINERNSIDTIKNVANVCCVQFSSYSSHLLAFGSADYKIYCYDLRNTKVPWCILSGHGKAVSYVKFLDSGTLSSASTDNSLKLWDLNRTSGNGLSKNACTMTFSGHTNEKNFVGLSVCDGYITCGSETNEVYAYYKTFPMPIASHKFGSIDPFTAQETSDDNGQFVSSICWRGKSNMVVAANSTGSIKVLQLV